MVVDTPTALTSVSIVMAFEPAKLEDAVELLVGATQQIRIKHGCVSCRVERDAVDERLVHYSEEWESAEAFRRHVRSQEFWPVLIAMELAAREPMVTLGDLAVRHGIGLLSELRGGAGTNSSALEPRPGTEE
jgi:quinol monooxygenase YgiN